MIPTMDFELLEAAEIMKKGGGYARDENDMFLKMKVNRTEH